MTTPARTVCRDPEHRQGGYGRWWGPTPTITGNLAPAALTWPTSGWGRERFATPDPEGGTAGIPSHQLRSFPDAL